MAHGCPIEANADVFNAMYAFQQQPGVVSRWDQQIFQLYRQKSIMSSLDAGFTLDFILEQRHEDDAWFANIWNDDDLRQGLLHANLIKRLYMPNIICAHLTKANGWLLSLEPDIALETSIRMFGPWKLASRWLDAILNGTLEAKNDVLQHTLWMYCKHSMEDTHLEKSLDIQTGLNKLSNSLSGALLFYVSTQPLQQYKQHMHAIFNSPAPEKDTALFFLSLSHLSEHYKASPNPQHPWCNAQTSWPEACQLLNVFQSLYPDVESARRHVAVVGESFEQRHSRNHVDLPILTME